MRARAWLGLAPFLAIAGCTPEDEAELDELGEALAWGIPVVFLSIVVAGLLIATATVALVGLLRKSRQATATAPLVLGILLVAFGLGAVALVFGARAAGVGMHWGFFVEPVVGVVAGAASIVASSLQRRAAADPAALAGARAAQGVVIGAGGLVALVVAILFVGSALPNRVTIDRGPNEPVYAEEPNPLYPGRRGVRDGDAERRIGEAVVIDGIEVVITGVDIRRVKPEVTFQSGLYAFVRYRATNRSSEDASVGAEHEWDLEAPARSDAEIDAFADAGEDWPFGLDLARGETRTAVVPIRLGARRADLTAGDYYLAWGLGPCAVVGGDPVSIRDRVRCRGVWRILTAADV